MCGVAGVYNFMAGEPVSAGLVQAMCDVMAYRGPDDAGVHVEGPVGLGHRRLSILDLSALGHQPMASADGTVWIVFNGEIYNFLELRKDLEARGCSFRSHCDTEVILALYQEHGEECVKLLRGMFALAIWDRNSKSLLLARDRLGKKPLFYCSDGRRLHFGSEIKCILEDPTVKREIDFEAFYDYFKYMYIPDPKTIYKGIRKLEPGHYLVCSGEGQRMVRYWDVSFGDPVTGDERHVGQELLGVLEESVRLRMISDVPLGAFLSGGIDSSCIVALMARQQGTPVTTCSIGFDSEKYDEVQFARVIADQFQTDHHEFTVKEHAKEILPSLARHFDEPFADSSAVPTYYVSKLARTRVTVALAGDGGDENFAGYEKYHLDDVENRLRSLIPGILRRGLFPALARRLASADGMLLQKGATLSRALAAEPAYGFYLSNTQFNGPLWDELLAEDTRRAIGSYDPYFVTEQHYRRAECEDHLGRILYTDLKTYLPGDILVKVDRMSMANSLEVRAPILDHRVVEFAARIPSGLKYCKGEKKYVLKKALGGVLPREILYRRKMGFSVPLPDWFRGELKSFAGSRLLDPAGRVNRFFRPEKVRELWDVHQAGTRSHSTALWALLMFELWHREFMG